MPPKLSAAVLLALVPSLALADERLEQALAPYFDLDRNGLDKKERQEMMEHIKGLQSRSVQTVEFERQEHTKKDDQWVTGLLLRDAYATGVFLDSNEQISDAGALFSYTHDGNKDSNTLAATGALMFGAVGELNRNYDGPPEAWRATRLGFLGGAEFATRWSGGDKSGTVTAHFGAELETAQGGIFPFQYWKVDGVYTTDFDGGASVFGIEAKWMPISGTLPIGKTWSLDGGQSTWVYFRPTLNIDYSHVFDNGEFSALVPGTEYLWAGVKADMALFFTSGPFQPFSVKAKYIYMYDLLRSNDDPIHYGQVAVNYALNDSGSTFLQARYTYGNTPRTLQKQDQFYIGLTAFFGDLK